jgi:hypothetical protein
MSKKIVDVRASLFRDGRYVLGFATLTFPNGFQHTIRVREDIAPIVRGLTRRAAPLARSVLSGIGADRAHEIGFFAKFGRWVKRTAKAIAQSKIIRGILKGVRKVLRSPVIAKMVGLASFIPIVGPALKSGYDLARGADAKVSALVKRAKAGNVVAQGIVKAVAKRADAGHPAAINLAARMAQAVSN